MKHKVREPYMIDDLVVYFTSEKEAMVIDYDCRYELKTSLEKCDCCTFRFNFFRNRAYQCRHIKAMRKLMNA